MDAILPGTALGLVALALAASLAGAELAVAALVHPAVASLGDAGRPARAALARRLGAGMPAWYALAAIAAAALLGAVPALPGWTAAGLLALAIVATLALLVPRNARIGRVPASDAEVAAWARDVREWDRLHAVRVAVLALAVVALAAGLAAR
ncbi:hypothetical protein USB125703_01863 [Pseudoclavibacter triregionum]|nr:hypothetical protein USB125703_01863 [Pseudoclavibacter triregionum]